MLGAVGRTLRNVIGEPSDSKRNSYFLPYLSVAEQAMLETCPNAKFPSCRHIPAGFDERYRQAIHLRPVLGIQKHPIDRQFIEILIGSTSAIRPGERDDVVVVGGIIERNGEIGSSVGAVGPRNGLACEIAACNVKDAAPARHQREQIRIRLLRPDLVDSVLGQGWCDVEKQNSGEDLPVNSHRHVHSKKSS
jgi:hypothetical protein